MNNLRELNAEIMAKVAVRYGVPAALLGSPDDKMPPRTLPRIVETINKDGVIRMRIEARPCLFVEKRPNLEEICFEEIAAQLKDNAP